MAQLIFPNRVIVDIGPKSVVTDKFREQIRESFKEFTEGTRGEYQFLDKLRYIDLIRWKNFPVDEVQYVNEYIRNTLEEESEITLNQFGSPDILEDVVSNAIFRLKKPWSEWNYDPHISEPAYKFVLAAIKEVLNYGAEEP